MERERNRHVKSIVGDLLKKWEGSLVKKAGEVQNAWAASVTQEDNVHARPAGLKNGILLVITDSSNYSYKLTLEKKGILSSFNRNYSGRKKAKDIRFRVGSFEA